MTRFENKLCPVCRRPFTENDDIVVCPVCGTPHHRACYNEKGGCGVEEWHASGFVWEGHLPGEEPEPSNGQEEQSGVDLSKHDDTEGQSGDYSDHRAEYPGGVPNGSFNAYGPDGQPVDIQEFLDQINRQTMDDTRGEDGVSAKELSCYVGKSVMHYSQAFAAFRAPAAPGQKKRKVFFNLCAGCSRRCTSSTGNWTPPELSWFCSNLPTTFRRCFPLPGRSALRLWELCSSPPAGCISPRR